MTFYLGKLSQKRLSGVHEDLAAVVRRAIAISPVDFTVLEGVRSQARQEELVRAGKSKTMNSRHLTGHAADLGAWVDGKVSWEWHHYPRIAWAMMKAVQDLGIPVTWGGVWDVPLLEFTGTPEEEVAEYVARRKEEGHRTFLDGPHFQLTWEAYPPFVG